jgi:hypothetical protein
LRHGPTELGVFVCQIDLRSGSRLWMAGFVDIVR